MTFSLLRNDPVQPAGACRTRSVFSLGHELARLERGVQRLVKGILLRIVILKAK